MEGQILLILHKITYSVKLEQDVELLKHFSPNITIIGSLRYLQRLTNGLQIPLVLLLFSSEHNR